MMIKLSKFKSGNVSIEIGINHKEYAHTTKLTEDNINSINRFYQLKLFDFIGF